MQIKLYQTTICYSNYTVQTPICESVEIDVENGKVVEPYGVHYCTIERN